MNDAGPRLSHATLQKHVSNESCNNGSPSPISHVHQDNLKHDVSVARHEVIQDTQLILQRFIRRSLNQTVKSSQKLKGHHSLNGDGKLPYPQQWHNKHKQENYSKEDTISRPTKTSAIYRCQNMTIPSQPSSDEVMDGIPTVTTEDQTPISTVIGVRASSQCSRPEHYEYLSDDNTIVTHLLKLVTCDCSGDFPSNSSKQPVSEKTPHRSHGRYGNGRQDELKSLYSGDSSRVHLPTQSQSLRALDRVMGTNEEKHPAENKKSFCEKMKRMMSSASSRRKSKHKKSSEQPKHDQALLSEEVSWFGKDGNSSSGARTATTSDLALTRDFPESKQKVPFGKSSPAPKTKLQLTPKILRSFTAKHKPSPKTKRHLIRQSGSSNSLSHYSTADVGGDLSRKKSGSVPLSMKYDVDKQLYYDEERRFSGEFPAATKCRERQSKKKRFPSPRQQPTEPQRSHLYEKKRSTGKFKRIIHIFRRRHDSESSTGSSRSQSLPSIPAAIEAETGLGDELVKAEDDDPFSAAKKIHDERMKEDDVLISDHMQKPYHHQGSLSFSSSDLYGLDDTEKGKLIEEIADTLSRLSDKYNRCLQNRSAPGSRISTSDSSSSTNDFRLHSKASCFRSPSNRLSRSDAGPIRPSRKSAQKSKDEKQPVRTTFLNLRSQRRTNSFRLERHETTKPSRRVHSRYAHHTEIQPSNSPHPCFAVIPQNGLEFVRDQIPPPSTSSLAYPIDVVDGNLPPLSPADSFPPTSADTEPEQETTHLDKTAFLWEVAAATTSGPCAPSRNGSDVDTISPCLSSIPLSQLDTDESQPCTSAMSLHGGIPPSNDVIDEDKLVDLLVEALCKKGDQYTSSIDMPHGLQFEPLVRSSVIRYMKKVTYDRFRHFYHRFCQSFEELVASDPARYPEVLPVVMVFNMTGLIVRLVSSETTQQAVDNLDRLSTRLANDVMENTGIVWGRPFLQQLRNAEEDLTETETTVYPTRPPSADDELD